MHRALRCSKRKGMAPVPPTVHNRIEGTHKEQNGHVVKPCGTLVRSTDSEPFSLTLTPAFLPISSEALEKFLKLRKVFSLLIRSNNNNCSLIQRDNACEDIRASRAGT